MELMYILTDSKSTRGGLDVNVFAHKTLDGAERHALSIMLSRYSFKYEKYPVDITDYNVVSIKYHEYMSDYYMTIHISEVYD